MKAVGIVQKNIEWITWFLAFLALILLAPRVFAEVPVTTRPQQVTVFPDSARVVREGSLKLLAGAQHVVFPDLPASLVESSLRLSVEGPAGTKFYGVGLRNEFTPGIVEERTRLLKDRLQVLEDHKADLADRIEARKTELDILKGLAKQGADTVQNHPSTLPDFTRNAGSVGARIAKLLAANRLDERAIRSLDLKITALNNQINQGNSQAREKRVAEADLEMPRAGLTRFTLTYQVSGASWTPLYDLRLGTVSEKPGLDLDFNAGVRQSTGEDWKNVALTLSTARPTQGTQVPDPTGWWLDFLNQQVYKAKKAFGMAKSLASRTDNFTATNSEDKDEEADEPALAPAPVESAETVRSEYAVAYKVLSRRDIPSDGSEHRVGVSQNSYPVKLTLVAVPRLSEAAYLEAKVTYTGEQTLLPGVVQLYRDGDFVGTTGLEAKAPGESFELGFGQDDQIRVTRKAMKDETGDAQGIFDYNKGEHRYRWVTTIANYHIGNREVEIREQLPRSRQQNIEVTLGDIAPKAVASDPAKPGLVTWDLTLTPKQKTQVDFSYRVKYPEGSQVTGLE